MLAGSVRAFLHEGAGIAVELDAERFGDRFSFGNERVEERAGGRESTGCTVVELGESADRIGGGVEDELRPLRAAGVLQRNDFQACAIQKLRKLFDARIGSIRWFERADPRIPIDIEANVAGFDDVPGWEGGAANDVAHAPCENFFVTYAILHRANSAGGAEQMSRLLDGGTRVRALRGHDSKFAGRDFLRICRCVEACSEIHRSADA